MTTEIVQTIVGASGKGQRKTIRIDAQCLRLGASSASAATVTLTMSRAVAVALAAQLAATLEGGDDAADAGGFRVSAKEDVR